MSDSNRVMAGIAAVFSPWNKVNGFHANYSWQIRIPSPSVPGGKASCVCPTLCEKCMPDHSHGNPLHPQPKTREEIGHFCLLGSSIFLSMQAHGQEEWPPSLSVYCTRRRLLVSCNKKNPWENKAFLWLPTMLLYMDGQARSKCDSSWLPHLSAGASSAR